MFRFTLVDFVMLDGVQQTLLRQLSFIVTRAITVAAQARRHLFLSGITGNGNKSVSFLPIVIREDFPPSTARFLGVRFVRHTRTIRERSTMILWTNAPAA